MAATTFIIDHPTDLLNKPGSARGGSGHRARHVNGVGEMALSYIPAYQS
jgi:hypothetical protein